MIKTNYLKSISHIAIGLFLVALVYVGFFEDANEYKILPSVFAFFYLFFNNFYLKRLVKEKDQEIFELKLKLKKIDH